MLDIRLAGQLHDRVLHTRLLKPGQICQVEEITKVTREQITELKGNTLPNYVLAFLMNCLSRLTKIDIFCTRISGVLQLFPYNCIKHILI